jgi:hypothetical protein
MTGARTRFLLWAFHRDGGASAHQSDSAAGARARPGEMYPIIDANGSLLHGVQISVAKKGIPRIWLN